MVILTAKVVNKIIEALFPKIYQKVFAKLEDLIEPLHKYVHEPNELDDKVASIEKRLSSIEDKCSKCSCNKCSCSSGDKKWYDE